MQICLLNILLPGSDLSVPVEIAELYLYRESEIMLALDVCHVEYVTGESWRYIYLDHWEEQ